MSVIAAKLKGPGPAKYKLPGTTGFQNHDATKKQMPAFSFGKRFKTNYESCSPGPSYMVPQFVTRTGRATAPAYSLYGRTKSLTQINTPAPGKYSPEKYPIPHNKRAPCYSFGCRTTEAKIGVSPAPNAYTLPTMIGPQSPAYSICGRPKIGAYYEDLQKTPGPGTYKVCNPNIYLSKGPAYSIKGRHDVITDKIRKPGPGAYTPEKVWLHKKTAPSFSFGVRHTEYITMATDMIPPIAS